MRIFRDQSTNNNTRELEKFIFREKEARFTNNKLNLDLKEQVAQYGDYIQTQIEKYLEVNKGYFGDEIRYGLCPEGAIAIFQKNTVGTAMFGRLRGVYLEENLIQELSNKKINIYALYPPIIAHEICHDFNYTENRYENYYESYEDKYSPEAFYYHLNELKIDKKSFEMLKEIPLDYPKTKSSTKNWSLAQNYLLLNKVELDRFKAYVANGRIEEIMGDNNLNNKLTLKFARSLARANYALANSKFTSTIQKSKDYVILKIYQRDVKNFLLKNKFCTRSEFDKLVASFDEFLRNEK